MDGHPAQQQQQQQQRQQQQHLQPAATTTTRRHSQGASVAATPGPAVPSADGSGAPGVAKDTPPVSPGPPSASVLLRSSSASGAQAQSAVTPSGAGAAHMILLLATLVIKKPDPHLSRPDVEPQ